MCFLNYVAAAINTSRREGLLTDGSNKTKLIKLNLAQTFLGLHFKSRLQGQFVGNLFRTWLQKGNLGLGSNKADSCLQKRRRKSGLLNY